MENLRATPEQALRAFFLLASVAALSVNYISALREKFLLYGSRQHTSPTAEKSPREPSPTKSLFDYASLLQVPHSWFIHFYIASVTWSIFWAFQIYSGGSVFKYLASLSTKGMGNLSPAMTVNQVIITWALMTMQGVRRLAECVSLSNPTKSKMPVSSWAIGIAFYTAVGMSVWVEGVPSLLENKSFQDITISKPSFKTFVALPIFILASGIQHDCHEYLASLKKYSLPEHEFFQLILCPHYTCECAIYISLAIISAPEGKILNKTMSMALLFTAVNLALTAETSREWYIQKFGAEKIKGRWRMLPFLY